MSSWFAEELHPYYRKGIRVKRILADEETKYQHLQVVETEFFGNALIRDGIIQVTERDNMDYYDQGCSMLHEQNFPYPSAHYLDRLCK